MDEGSNIYGTVVKRTVMEEGPDYSNDPSCKHSSDTVHHIRKPSRWSATLLFAAAFVTLGGSIPIGYICGTSTNPYHVEDSWVRLPMVTLRSMLLVGGVVGSMSCVVAADCVGRRGTSLGGQVMGVLGATAHLAASITQSQAILVAAWLILGVFVGVGVCVLPLYLVELSPPSLRNSLGAVYTVGTAVGLLLSQTLSLHCALAIGSGHPFLVPIFAVPVVLSWFIFPHVPESPMFLHFVKKDFRLAASEMANLRGVDVDLAEAELNGCEANGTPDFTLPQLLRQPMYVTLVFAAYLSQALGESDQLYHLSAARPLLAEADVVAAGYTASVINCIMALMLVQLISAVSWRVLLIVSCVNSSVLLLIMAAFAVQEDISNQVTYLMLVTLLLQVIVFDLGLRSIPCFLACELFDTKAAAAMMGVGGAVSFLGQLMSDYLFLNLGVSHFRLFAAVFLALFVVLLLISTTGKSKHSDAQSMSLTPPKSQTTVSDLPNPH